jgi:flagellar hook-associated protein 1 FlgK
MAKKSFLENNSHTSFSGRYMRSFAGLEIGKRALIAQRLGLDVTSNNIANVNTPGYARQQAIFSETQPELLIGRGYIGTGTNVTAIRTYREEYLDREIRHGLSRKAGYEADGSMMQRIETSLGEPSEYGLDASMKQFFNSFQDLSLNPENIAKRNLVLSAGQSMAETFRTTAEKIRDIRTQTRTGIENSVTDMNRILKDLASLNKEMVTARSRNLDTSNTLVSQRAQKLEELSKYAGSVNISVDQDGLANVIINGNTVVTGAYAATLKTSETIAPSGERSIAVNLLDVQGNPTAMLMPDSGELASLIKHYNVTLDDKDSSGGFSVAKNLNDLAAAIVQKVNAASSTGFGLDDTVAPARNFFNPTGTDAFSMTLDPAVDGQPRNIPAAAAAGNPGDNTIVRQIANLMNDGSFINGNTAQDFYTGLLTKIGAAGTDAETGTKVSTTINDQLTAQRESVIGVNLDEEAVNLIKFQKAYEASARIISVTNELLGTLINLGR